MKPTEIGLRKYIAYQKDVGTKDRALPTSEIQEIIDYIDNNGNPDDIPPEEDSGLPDDMPDDYEGDVTEEDIEKMMEDDTSEGGTD